MGREGRGGPLLFGSWGTRGWLRAGGGLLVLRKSGVGSLNRPLSVKVITKINIFPSQAFTSMYFDIV